MKFLEREVRKSNAAEPLSYYHQRWTRDDAPLLDELGAVIDHIEAFSTGGPDCKENFATACNKCNTRKSSAPLDEWSKRPQRNPVREVRRTPSLGRLVKLVHGPRLPSRHQADLERKRVAVSTAKMTSTGEDVRSSPWGSAQIGADRISS